MPDRMNPDIWKAQRELLRYQAGYIQTVASEKGLLSPALTNLKTLHGDHYDIGADIEALTAHLTEGNPFVKKGTDRTDIALVSTAVASCIRRGRKSKVYSGDKEITDHIERLFFECRDGSDLTILQNGALERLSKKSTSVGSYFMGNRGDLFTATNTAGIAKDQRLITEQRARRAESRRLPRIQ